MPNSITNISNLNNNNRGLFVKQSPILVFFKHAIANLGRGVDCAVKQSL